jgi:hypothetical protein
LPAEQLAACWFPVGRDHVVSDGCGSSEVTARGGFSVLRVVVSGLPVAVCA